MSAPYCCMSCRLIQAETAACRECGSTVVSAFEHGAGLLQFHWSARDEKTPVSKSALTAGAGVVAGLSVASVLGAPVLLIPAVAGCVVLTAGTLIASARKRRALEVVPPVAPNPGNGAVTYTGIARRLAKVLSTDGVLAKEIVLGNKHGVLFRGLHSVPFVVELDGGEHVVVTGVVRVESAGKSEAVKRDDRRIAELGVPADVVVAGNLVTRVVRDGDRVTVTGVESQEIVQELAFHRDAGGTAVMHGRAGAVVIARG